MLALFLYDQSDTQNSLEEPRPQNFATAWPPPGSCSLLMLHLEAEFCSSENAELPPFVLRSCFLPTASEGLPPPPWVPSTHTAGRCYSIRKDNPGQASFHAVKSRTSISYHFLIHPCMVATFQWEQLLVSSVWESQVCSCFHNTEDEQVLCQRWHWTGWFLSHNPIDSQAIERGG